MMRRVMGTISRTMLGTAIVLVAGTACSPHAEEASPTPSAQVFPDEETKNYSMGFSGDLPLDSSDATAIASDASGKGPFVANVGCDGGGTLSLRVDDGAPRDIPCNGAAVRIIGIQKVARTGGVKFFMSSDQHEGHWKIQLIGSKP